MISVDSPQGEPGVDGCGAVRLAAPLGCEPGTFRFLLLAGRNVPRGPVRPGAPEGVLTRFLTAFCGCCSRNT